MCVWDAPAGLPVSHHLHDGSTSTVSALPVSQDLQCHRTSLVLSTPLLQDLHWHRTSTGTHKHSHTSKSVNMHTPTHTDTYTPHSTHTNQYNHTQLTRYNKVAEGTTPQSLSMHSKKSRPGHSLTSVAWSTSQSLLRRS